MQRERGEGEKLRRRRGRGQRSARARVQCCAARSHTPSESPFEHHARPAPAPRPHLERPPGKTAAVGRGRGSMPGLPEHGRKRRSAPVAWQVNASVVAGREGAKEGGRRRRGRDAPEEPQPCPASPTASPAGPCRRTSCLDRQARRVARARRPPRAPERERRAPRAPGSLLRSPSSPTTRSCPARSPVLLHRCPARSRVGLGRWRGKKCGLQSDERRARRGGGR